MRSKITIDVDGDNQPIIKVDYYYSEDVRDKLVKRFLEKFGHASIWATAIFTDPNKAEYQNATVIITPLQCEDLSKESEVMKTWGDKYAQQMS